MDLNAERNDIPSVENILRTLGWTDIGAIGGAYGESFYQPTSMALNATVARRRDFILANATALPLVKEFRVVDLDDLPAHSLLQLRTAAEPDIPHRSKAFGHMNFAAMLSTPLLSSPPTMKMKHKYRCLD